MSRIRPAPWVLLGLFLANFLLGWRAEAQSRGGGFSGVAERAEKREGTRWTLQEWLAQRDRNRMMDLWLSMNSPSPFEFMLGGSYLSSTTSVDNPPSDEKFTNSGGELRAYAQFVGLTLEYANHSQENFTDLNGMLNLRLFGDSLQNSSLTVSVGQHSRALEVAGERTIQRNLLTQADLQLYLAKYFGASARYRSYAPATNDVSGDSIRGSETEAGLFIDFKSVRVFGAFYQDLQVNTNDAATSAFKREGIKSGLQFYY